MDAVAAFLWSCAAASGFWLTLVGITLFLILGRRGGNVPYRRSGTFSSIQIYAIGSDAPFLHGTLIAGNEGLTTAISTNKDTLALYLHRDGITVGQYRMVELLITSQFLGCACSSIRKNR